MACSFQLFLGRIYTFYSAKKVFLSCIFLFEVGSAICGAAPNSPVFIVGRAVAGLGAAGIFGGAIILTMFLVPLHKRPVFVSLNGAVFGISSAVGPRKLPIPCRLHLTTQLTRLQ
jgi:MFS family permease